MFLCSFLYMFIWIFSSYLCEESVCSHETKYFLMIHRCILRRFSWLRRFCKLHTNGSISPLPFSCQYKTFYLFHIVIFTIFLEMSCISSCFPCIVSWVWHPSNVTEHFEWMLCGKFPYSFPLDAEVYCLYFQARINLKVLFSSSR